jgi:hypothetical protein
LHESLEALAVNISHQNASLKDAVEKSLHRQAKTLIFMIGVGELLYSREFFPEAFRMVTSSTS